MRLAVPLLAVALLAIVQHGAAQEPAVDKGAVLRHAKVLRANHQLETAAHVLDSFLLKNPDDADALTLLAQIRLDQSNTSAAKNLLTRALRSSPNSPTANITLGRLMLL